MVTLHKFFVSTENFKYFLWLLHNYELRSVIDKPKVIVTFLSFILDGDRSRDSFTVNVLEMSELELLLSFDFKYLRLHFLDHGFGEWMLTRRLTEEQNCQKLFIAVPVTLPLELISLFKSSRPKFSHHID